MAVKDKDAESIETGLSQIFQLSSATSKGVDTWYPTVRKTVWVLSQLFEFVQVRSFLRSFLFPFYYIFSAMFSQEDHFVCTSTVV